MAKVPYCTPPPTDQNDLQTACATVKYSVGKQKWVLVNHSVFRPSVNALLYWNEDWERLCNLLVNGSFLIKQSMLF